MAIGTSDMMRAHAHKDKENPRPLSMANPDSTGCQQRQLHGGEAERAHV